MLFVRKHSIRLLLALYISSLCLGTVAHTFLTESLTCYHLPRSPSLPTLASLLSPPCLL